MYREIYAEAKPEMRRLLDYAGLDPDRCVIRWGNFDRTLLLPGSVFREDDDGRSYALRPGTRSVWLRRVALPRDLSGFFLVPDGPDLDQHLPRARDRHRRLGDLEDLRTAEGLLRDDLHDCALLLTR